MQRAEIVLGLILALMFSHIVRESAASPQRDEWRENEKLDKTFKVRTDRDFRLRLDVDAGEVRMSRGQNEDELRVHLLYSKKEFRHAFRFNEQDNFLEIRFDKEGWFDHRKDRLKAELELELPRDATMRADCKIKAGEVDMQLGGLRLTDFALSVTAGSVNIDFDQPNRVEMESLTLNTKIGESKFRRLGNARFRDADLNGGIGEMTIDFSGEMLADAVARVDLDIGETVIVLPQDTGTKLAVSKFLFLSQIDLPFNLHKEGRYYYTENYHEDDRGFQLRVSSGIGELRVERP